MRKKPYPGGSLSLHWAAYSSSAAILFASGHSVHLVLPSLNSASNLHSLLGSSLREFLVFPPTLVKEDEALPETADCRMDLTVVLRWGHDEPVVVCNPVLRSVN